MPETYRVIVEKELLVFSAAHFITFGDDICESLHGHNYAVRAEVEGELNRHGYVVDFIALRDELQRLTTELDHKVLLPDRHASIEVKQQGEEVLVNFPGRRWVFPRDNCVILPVSNTTAELLAAYLGRRISQWLERLADCRPTRLVIGVDENRNQWGLWEWSWPTP